MIYQSLQGNPLLKNLVFRYYPNLNRNLKYDVGIEINDRIAGYGINLVIRPEGMFYGTYTTPPLMSYEMYKDTIVYSTPFEIKTIDCISWQGYSRLGSFLGAR